MSARANLTDKARKNTFRVQPAAGVWLTQVLVGDCCIATNVALIDSNRGGTFARAYCRLPGKHVVYWLQQMLS